MRQCASKTPLGAAGAIIIVGVLLVAASAELLAPYEAHTADYAAQFTAPSAEHWFGTDEFGRDLPLGPDGFHWDN